MDTLQYTEEHRIFRDSLKRFLAKEIVPHIEEWEEAGIVPRGAWKKMGEQGFLAMGVREEYGGLGADFLYSVIVAEGMARTNHTGLAASLHSDIIVPYLQSFASEEQKHKYLPGCVSGDIITAVAMTEPGIGSDLASMATTAIADGDSFIVNGSKTFITNGINSDLVIVAAKTDPSARHAGISLLVLERGMEGFERGRNLDKIGLHAQDTAE
ncbi:MAG: acyl-CoA dehydrogenase family protein, partial [Deltaproteobacteria bacterium]|nr:acyl-CoA dehydrogenase family protein [Deltaproteobacteria bacterium]